MRSLFPTVCVALLMLGASQAAAIEPQTAAVTHGSYGTMDGRTWRYHQIYSGVWQGIPPDEWDDNVHVKNDNDLDETTSTALIAQAGNQSLNARDIRGTCHSAFSCTAIAATAAAASASIQENWAALLQKIVAANQNMPDIWGFLNKPFVATLIGGVPTWLGAITTVLLYVKPTAPVASCSNQNTEMDVINTAVQQGLAALGHNSSNYLKIDIALPDGRMVGVSISSTPQPDQGGCGSPPTTGQIGG